VKDLFNRPVDKMWMDRQDIMHFHILFIVLSAKKKKNPHKNEHLRNIASNKKVLCQGFFDRKTRFLSTIYSNEVV
jgi:hypothetical protein